jgi:LAO/AO transport system kinase
LADIEQLVDGAAAGQPRSVGRLISLIEDGVDIDPAGFPPLRETTRLLVERLAAVDRPPAQVVGLTGSPGVGKSTTTAALVAAYRRAGKRVGVLAVDPSSPFTGGALLGDRVRMQDHALDEGVFIRSMASRGHLGGLAWATPQAVRVLDVAGCDVVLVETVGVGQAEVEIASLADTTAVLVAPGMGDAIQAAKAGILEIADVFVVNKADRDGAQQTARDLRHMLSLGADERAVGGWTPPIVLSVATKSEGVDDVVAAIERHREWLGSSGEGARRRRARIGEEIAAIVLSSVRRQLEAVRGGSALDELAGEVLEGRSDPFAAADRLTGEVLS